MPPAWRGRAQHSFLRTQCTSPIGRAQAYVSCSTAGAACPPVLWAGARRGPFPWPTAQRSALLLLCFTEQALAPCPQPAAPRALGEEVGAPLSTTGGLQEYEIPGGVPAWCCRGQGVQTCPMQVPAGPRAVQQGTPGAYPCILLLQRGTPGLGGGGRMGTGTAMRPAMGWGCGCWAAQQCCVGEHAQLFGR